MQREVETFLRREEGKDISAGTLKERKTVLTQFTEWTDERGQDATELNALDLEDFLAFLKREGYAGSTVSQKYNSLSKLYSYLEKRGAVDDNPVEEVKLKEYVNGKTKKENTDNDFYLNPEQFAEMVEHVPQPKLRNELILRLLWQTGLRRAELMDVKLDHLDRDERRIEVKTKKTDEWRNVWYKPSLDFLMSQWVDVYRESLAHSDSPYLFITTHSEQMYSELVNRAVKQAADAIGIQEEMYVDAKGDSRKKITAHTLRHSYAVHAVKDGMDVARLMELMGHSQLETTKQYLKYKNEDLKEAAMKFGPGGQAAD